MGRPSRLIAPILMLAIGFAVNCGEESDQSKAAIVSAASGTGGMSASSASTSSVSEGGGGSTTSASSAGAGGADCGEIPVMFASHGAKCTSCLDMFCCAPAKACDPGTDCFVILSCESECMGDAACIAACQSATPSGDATSIAFDHCLDVVCGVECGVDVICDANLQAGDEECATCLGHPDPTGCCSDFEAFDCASDKATCSKNIDALDACAGDATSAACTANPVAAAAYACLASRCALCGD